MFRKEFSDDAHRIVFTRDGGRCRCMGCNRPNLFWNGHTGRCLSTFQFGMDRRGWDADYGYNVDHVYGAWNNDPSNGRILCLACHKQKTSLAAALEAATCKANPYEDAMRAIFGQPDPAPPWPLSQVVRRKNWWEP